MKTFLILPIVLLGLLTTAARAQSTDAPRTETPERLTFLPNSEPDGVYRPVELGAHHRVMQKITEVLGEDGFPTIITNRYVELATGMHRWDAAQEKWTEASDEIEVLEDRAVARQSAHQVAFAGNANDPEGAIELVTPDGQRLRSRVVGLAYTESDTGRSVFLAELKDAQGVVVGRNQVFYPDAFDNGIQADLRYTTTRSSFEQDVILREKLPSPAEYGLKPGTTRLEVWTEFLEAPEPVKTDQELLREDGRKDADVTLEFGSMRIEQGRAFSLEDAPADAGHRGGKSRVLVGKQWETIQGSRYLIETVPYFEVKAEIDTLPEPRERAQIPPTHRSRLQAHLPGATRMLPVSLANARRSPSRNRETEMARADRLPARPGYVLDYFTVTSQYNTTFNANHTYYVTGTVNLSGTTTIEGGTVIKFDKHTGSNYPRLAIAEQVRCLTDTHMPAIFTAKDDNTIGETIAGSTGTPTGYYAYEAVSRSSISYYYNTDLHDLRFRYANTAIVFSSVSASPIVRHVQFVGCEYAVSAYSSTSVTLANGLFCQASSYLYVDGSSSMDVGYCTFDVGGNAPWGYYSTPNFDINHCLFAGATWSPAIIPSSTGNNYVTNTTAGVFQTVGAGSHYLAASSPYRNLGWASGYAAWQIRYKTTYAPQLMTNAINSDTTWSLQAQRDTDTPDIGYHYDPLDYCVTDLVITNATLYLTNGVAIGVYGLNGFILQSGSKLVHDGGPGERMGKLVRYHSVQEAPIRWGAVDSGMRLLHVAGNQSVLPEVRLRFVGVGVMADSSVHRNYLVENVANNKLGHFSLRDCQLYGTFIWMKPTNDTRQSSVHFHNNLFIRGSTQFYQGLDGASPLALSLRNNLFHGSLMSIGNLAGLSAWPGCYDNVFSQVAANYATNAFPNGFNAYHASQSLPGSMGGDVALGGVFFNSGRLGPFYLWGNSGLENKGSRSAAEAGLYHHTTQTSLVKEGASMVDIGFHYAITDIFGQPQDYDSDGVPDIIEDYNGNGMYDPGETDWTAIFKVFVTVPKSNSQLP